MCAEGLQCGGSGVCWMTWTDGCDATQRDIMNIDTCGRVISVASECDDNQHCEAGVCIAGPPPVAVDAGMESPDSGASDAGIDSGPMDGALNPLDAGLPNPDAQ